MSARALETAVRDYLRANLALPGQTNPLPRSVCDCTLGGRPAPGAGQTFVAVHAGGGWANGSDENLDERYGVLVTVTQRVAFAPFDRRGDPLLAATTGLEAVCEVVRAQLTADRYPVMNAANVLIGATHNGFVEPFRFRECQDMVERGPDWFGADPDDGAVGISRTLVFRDARRLQSSFTPDDGGAVNLGHAVVSCTSPGGTNVVRVTTAAPHGLSGGEAVTLAGTGRYDGSYGVVIVSPPTATTFLIQPAPYAGDSTGGVWAPA